MVFFIVGNASDRSSLVLQYAKFVAISIESFESGLTGVFSTLSEFNAFSYLIFSNCFVF